MSSYPRRIGKNSTIVTVPLGGGDQPIVVTIGTLSIVEHTLQYNITTNPQVDHGTLGGEKITGNIVGATLYGVPTGTTLNIEVIAVGY